MFSWQSLLSRAIFVTTAYLVLTEGTSTFSSNKATTNGGAIFATTLCVVRIEGVSTFSSNEAEDSGGAVYAGDSSLFVNDGAEFTSNVASTGSGGGIYASGAVVTLDQSTFTSISAVWGGGAALFSSGSFWNKDTLDSGLANVTTCTFDSNQAVDGGAIYSAAGYDMIEKSSFMRNFADVSGGAFLHSGVLVALTGSTFENNTAGEDGPAVMSLGQADNIANVNFSSNLFYCSPGLYGVEKDEGDVLVKTCRFAEVCSRCSSSCNDTPPTVSVASNDVPSCRIVPTGVNTTEEGGKTIATLDLRSGYYRTSNLSEEILECYRKEACNGGSYVSEYCATGYKGAYCAVCEEEYASEFQYSCRSCIGSAKWAAIGTAIALLVVVLAVVALVVVGLVRVVDGPEEFSGRWERRFSSCRDSLVRAISLTTIKIVVVAWQIITQFSAVANVEYPSAYQNFLEVLNLVNLNLGFILSFSCVLETNFYGQLLFATLGPMVVLAALATTYFISQRRNRHSLVAMRAAESKHASIALFIMCVVYSSVSFTVFLSV